MDCGISSVQLDSIDRGFSFQTEGCLDMRMAPEFDLTAADILNTYTKDTDEPEVTVKVAFIVKGVAVI